MSGFLTKQLLMTVILALSPVPAIAQATDNATPVLSSDRDASFMLSGGDISSPKAPDFSGLAAAPELISPPAASVAVVPPPPPSGTEKTATMIATPVSVATLPDVSAESVGTQSANGLGSGMWKGTPYAVAEALLSTLAVTTSPVLNDLVRRLLITAAVPPEGTAPFAQTLTALRIEKLIAFGDVVDAWLLTKNADPKLIDDVTYHLVFDNLLASGGEDPCAQLPDLIKTRPAIDWQKDTIICQLRGKDTKGAQVSLDVLRAQPNHDSIFLEVADKNILGTSKTLPSQLTPLTPALLALLRLTDMPLPGELYGHTDFALAAALLHGTAQQDVAQVGLAERAAARGIIDVNDLATVYRTVIFAPDILAAPLASVETGLRLRALLFHASEIEKDPSKRIAYAIKFLQSAPPELLNGAGSIVAMMLGDMKPDATLTDNDVLMAEIYMLAGRGDMAMAWMKFAQPTVNNASESQYLWPQFVLAGMESESGYATDLNKWVDVTLKQGNPQTDLSKARDYAASTLLILDAAGFTVPDEAWSKVLISSSTDKHIALSPLLLERLQAASAGGRRAESTLLSVDLAGDGDISLTATLAIIRSLRLAGLKPESANFARCALALMPKAN